MSVRVKLLKSLPVPYSDRVWPIGQIIQVLPQRASELIHDKIAEVYTDVYPPKKEKTKTDFFKPKNK